MTRRAMMVIGMLNLQLNEGTNTRRHATHDSQELTKNRRPDRMSGRRFVSYELTSYQLCSETCCRCVRDQVMDRGFQFGKIRFHPTEHSRWRTGAECVVIAIPGSQ